MRKRSKFRSVRFDHPMTADERQPPDMRRAATGMTVAIAEPDNEARATLYALHGGGLTGDYWDCRFDRSLSLVAAATRAGLRVAYPDRPGYRANADRWPAGLPAGEEAALHGATIADLFGDSPVVLVGQSAGAIVSLHAAGNGDVLSLAGLDYSGVGIRLAAIAEGKAPNRDEMRTRNWATPDLFPEGTFDRGGIPAAPTIDADGVSARSLGDVFNGLAAGIEVPVRVTFAESEVWWGPLTEVIPEVERAFSNSGAVSTHVEPRAAHNISLGFAARSYHAAVIAFAERCLQC
jgi:pimeloyl-ACP methyl ester carboxylesterase